VTVARTFFLGGTFILLLRSERPGRAGLPRVDR
jgi:hypothetical protein